MAKNPRATRPPARQRLCGASALAGWYLVLTLGAGVALAQEPAKKNPFEGDAPAIQQGQALFRARCANCHGVDARGVLGPDLTTGQFRSGGADEQLFRVIRRGIPGTEMTGGGVDDEAWMVLAYLRTLTAPAPSEARGNAQNGEAYFWNAGGCSSCHRVSGKGGRLGPDLSRIGATRSRSALAQQVRQASANIAFGYEPVTIVLRDKQRIRGVRKNEDTFSIQIMETTERLRGFRKTDVAELIDEKASLMPDYNAQRLSDVALDDLLAYLASLTGPAPASK
jgi:putative heme-binding domain-containing protein